MQVASQSLGAEQIDALKEIKDDDKRHLAMTYYLRAGKSIGARWSWTSERIKAYEQSAEYAQTLAEINTIAARFAADNPGYLLFTNTQVRSLEEQIARWQTVRSIAVAASELRKAALTQLAQASYEVAPSPASSKRFRVFLTTWRASPAPTLAAPGLSLHGRGRAYDFQIHDKKGRTVVGTDTSTIRAIWDGQGWTEKLS
ncbi:MAG: hypothetical protein H7Y02_03000, partial [Candidatus Obscuribacterales bacterium]|nr:hypothetical protein [Steroidobacteraceae bacterium]